MNELNSLIHQSTHVRSGSGSPSASEDSICSSDSAFREAMRRKGLSVVDVEPDGNCLFRSVSHQIYGDVDRHVQVCVCVCVPCIRFPFMAVHLFFHGDREVPSSCRCGGVFFACEQQPQDGRQQRAVCRGDKYNDTFFMFWRFYLKHVYSICRKDTLGGIMA